MEHNFSHESSVDDQKGLICPVPDCGKHFRFKSEMDRHLIVHSLERDFVCPIKECGKTFKRADTLSNHIRMHNNDLAFSCNVEGCGQQFTTKSALRYHVLKHEGDKKFKCSFPDCDRAFLTLAQLKQHEKASSYHKKIDNAIINQANRSMKQESDIALARAKSSLVVKDEALYSETQVSTDHPDSPINEETHKRIKTEADSVPTNTILHRFNSNMTQKSLSEGLVADNSQNIFITAMNVDTKKKDMLRHIMEENRRLKSSLNNMMFLDGIFANLRTMPMSMGLLGLQQAQLNSQSLAALQYNMSL